MRAASPLDIGNETGWIVELVAVVEGYLATFGCDEPDRGAQVEDGCHSGEVWRREGSEPDQRLLARRE